MNRSLSSSGGIDLASSKRFEGLDYEEVENTVYRADQASSTALDSLSYSFGKWIVCLLIGRIVHAAANVALMHAFYH